LFDAADCLMANVTCICRSNAHHTFSITKKGRRDSREY
jgi:hypothetical protein